MSVSKKYSRHAYGSFLRDGVLNAPLIKGSCQCFALTEGVRVSGGDLCTKCRSTDRAGRRDLRRCLNNVVVAPLISPCQSLRLAYGEPPPLIREVLIFIGIGGVLTLGKFDNSLPQDDFMVDYVKVYQNENFEQYIKSDDDFDGSFDLD